MSVSILFLVLVSLINCLDESIAKENRMKGQRSKANTRIVTASAVRNKCASLKRLNQKGYSIVTGFQSGPRHAVAFDAYYVIAC